uniref:Putative reverse transcriptase domain, ribonuclease H-like domain, aspartic peptidase domain protein n=1 Tax=Tanacetum cinerariifolium TaxID=118510 RepID=A0A699KE82_TANCI|nr:putative reverse transcriptase domain, ribonuclease H-like domain, aspartic peptidase domain protein [Tanacetum cinerariifolium]
MSMKNQSSIKAKILKAQSEASKDVNTPAEMLRGLDKQFKRKEDGGLYLVERICMPAYGNLRTLIMNKSDTTKYFIDPKADKMYYDETYIDDQKPSGLLQQPEIPEWKMGEYHNDTHIPLVESSYNNSYHSSMKCAPFEALYGTRCRTPIAWAEVGECKLIGSKIIQETSNKIAQIKERFKAARDRQKRYADNRRNPLEFSTGDKVLLKVSPWKGVVHFGKIRKTVRDCRASWSCSLSIALTTRSCRNS